MRVISLLWGQGYRVDWQELDDDIKSEIDGKFLQCVDSAMATPAVYDARELQKAMKVSWLADEVC